MAGDSTVGMNLGGYGNSSGFGEFGFEWVALVVGGVIKLVGNGRGVGHMVAVAAARHVWWRHHGLQLGFGVSTWFWGFCFLWVSTRFWGGAAVWWRCGREK
nr:hypothetical protein CFP56_02346 [Quercus suber]